MCFLSPYVYLTEITIKFLCKKISRKLQSRTGKKQDLRLVPRKKDCPTLLRKKQSFQMKHELCHGQQIRAISSKIMGSVWKHPISAFTQFLPWKPMRQCKCMLTLQKVLASNQGHRFIKELSIWIQSHCVQPTSIYGLQIWSMFLSKSKER